MEEFKDVVIVDENGNPDTKAMRKAKLKKFAEEAKKKTKKVATDVWHFVIDNKENLAYVAGLAVTGATALNKLKGPKRDEYRDFVDNSYYDQYTHTRFYLKRQLTNSENIELRHRVERGEYAGDVLRSMRVLR